MPHGWLILDKPIGLGSTQAVGAVKRNLREASFFDSGAKVKVGHGGTLDPLASGVLPVALGEATKLAGRMLDSDKVYEFTVAFGAETDSLDLEGPIVAQSDVRPTLTEIEAVLPRFTGPIEQVPPAYSALMIDGRRAYDRARAGEAVELASRQVTVRSLEILPGTGRGTMQSMVEGRGRQARGSQFEIDGGCPSTPGCAGGPPPRAGEEQVTFRAQVSKGTYIRSLARDIARALGSVGHVIYLRRTRAGPFGLESAISLDMLNEIGKGARLENVLLPLEAGLDGIPALDLGPEQARAVRQGRVLTGLELPDGVCWARCGSTPLALLQVDNGEAKVLRGFNLSDAAE